MITKSIYMAIVGTTWDKNKTNYNSYKNWINKKLRELNKINGVEQTTFWDVMATKRKSFKG